MKIAMFAHNYLPHPGGVEVVVWNLARGLAQRHDVVLVSSGYNGTSGVSREDGFEIHRLPSTHFTERIDVPYPLPIGRGVRTAFTAVSNADVVHAHGALYAQTLMARRAARRAGAPLVLTEHVGWVEYPNPMLNAVQQLAWRAIGDAALRRSSAVVALSARVHKWLEQRHDRAVHFIPNGVDLNRFRPRCEEERRALRKSFGLPDNACLALFVGRAAAKKNLDVVLAARVDGVTLVVCGAERGLRGDGLLDLGLVPYDRMPDLFACADVMIHAATGEGFPLAVQESIASGVPVVLLWDEGYGRLLPKNLVAACDHIDEIRPRLAELTTDASRRAALRVAGRGWAEQRWSWNAAVAAYEAVYEEVRAQ